MNTSLLGIGMLSAALVGGAIAHTYLQRGYSAAAEARAAELQEEVGELSSKIESIDGQIRDANAAATKSLGRKQSMADLVAEIAHLEKESKAAQDRWAEASHKMLATLNVGRKILSETVYPDLTLPRVGNLKQAKWAYEVDGKVTFNHAAGIARVALNELPANLSDLYMANWMPKLDLPKDPATKARERILQASTAASTQQQTAAVAPAKVDAVFATPSASITQASRPAKQPEKVESEYHWYWPVGSTSGLKSPTKRRSISYRSYRSYSRYYPT